MTQPAETSSEPPHSLSSSKHYAGVFCITEHLNTTVVTLGSMENTSGGPVPALIAIIACGMARSQKGLSRNALKGITRGLEHLRCEDRLGRAGAVQPGEKKAAGRPQNSCQRLRGPARKVGKIFSAGLVVTGQGVMALN